MRQWLVGCGLLVAAAMFVAGCGSSASTSKAPLPPNAEKIKTDIKNPGASLPPPPGTPGFKGKR